MALRRESCEQCAQLEDTIANLERAVQSRDVIGQAKGILMAANGVSADEAFALLARASQRENRRLYAIAEEVVERRSAGPPAQPDSWLRPLEQFVWRVRRAGVTLVVELVGELDLNTSPQFRDALVDIGIGGDSGQVVIDMSELSFIDSTGLGVLVEARRLIDGVGGSITLSQPRPRIMKVLEISGLTAMFPIARDGVEEIA